MSESLFYLILGLIAVGIGIFILKSFIKAIMLGFIVIIIFRVGWVYNADDMVNIFHLDKILNPEYIEEFYDGYSKYEEKREEDAVVNTKELDDLIQKELKEKINNFKKEL